MTPRDLICALATARGEGGIAIVRMSGEGAEDVLKRVFAPAGAHRAPQPIESHKLMYGHAVDADGEALDEVMAVLMRAPRSYTREDVAELQCHGGDMSARRIIARLIELGARPAEPGEFTKRAFLNGRIELSRAEAIMQLVGATNEAAARAGVRQLEGGVSGFVREVSSGLIAALARIEAATDFPDEIDEVTEAGEIRADLIALRDEIRRRCDPSALRLLNEGASIVLAGRANVGKSSLMNALLRQERAIVTALPGTTRDVLTEQIRLGSVCARLTDTAGQRSTQDPIEQIGVARAENAMLHADVVLCVLDASMPLTDEDRAILSRLDDRAVILRNKCDLETANMGEGFGFPVLRVSALRGEGIDELTAYLTERLQDRCAQDSLTVERHIRLATQAATCIEGAVAGIESGLPLDFTAIDLRQALDFLAQITATDPGEDVIDEIFSKFCVGK